MSFCVAVSILKDVLPLEFTGVDIPWRVNSDNGNVN